ncbi:DUF7537 family lipoprotein [Haloarchaeobius sp. TZWWS8]|uniref:DUF7537 family lipoprotein n=1 Tax=Haloarchaeobius sp. TZWWS8 TaxID=3446121 RepID=UPI003EB9B00A
MNAPTRPTLSLLLVAVVVLAGCTGGAAPNDSVGETQLTDSGEPTTDTAATGSAGPQATSTSGDSSAGTQSHPLASKRLSSTHPTSLQNAQNFTLEYAMDLTQETSMETQTIQFDWTVRADLSTGAQSMEGTLAGDAFTGGDSDSPIEIGLYVSPDGTATQRSVIGDTVDIQQVSADDVDVSTYLTAMNATAALDADAANFTYEGPTTVDGETLYVYSVSDLEQLYLPTEQADTEAFDDSSVTRFELRLLVDESGTVREMQYDLEVTEDDSVMTLQFELSYSDIGTTEVEEPDWLDAAGE